MSIDHQRMTQYKSAMCYTGYYKYKTTVAPVVVCWMLHVYALNIQNDKCVGMNWLSAGSYTVPWLIMSSKLNKSEG